MIHNSFMSIRWYALKRGTQYKVTSVNIHGVLYLKETEGWEIGSVPFDTREEAEAFLREWKDKEIWFARSERCD